MSLEGWNQSCLRMEVRVSTLGAWLPVNFCYERTPCVTVKAENPVAKGWRGKGKQERGYRHGTRGLQVIKESTQLKKGLEWERNFSRTSKLVVNSPTALSSRQRPSPPLVSVVLIFEGSHEGIDNEPVKLFSSLSFFSTFDLLSIFNLLLYVFDVFIVRNIWESIPQYPRKIGFVGNSSWKLSNENSFWRWQCDPGSAGES